MRQDFVLEVAGAFRPAQVRVVWRDEPAVSDPDIERLKEVWPAHVDKVTRQGGTLYNGPVVRYLGHCLTDGCFVIEAGPSDYATFYCTNYLNWHLGESLGWHRFGNPLGISANVITSDGWLLFGRRGDHVATHPGTIHTIGGSVEPIDRDGEGRIDVFAAMARELVEELRLEPGDLADMVCVGMIRDGQMHQPELVFDARLTRPRADIESRLPPGDAEHVALVACPDRVDAYPMFIRSSPEAVAVAVGSLHLHACRLGHAARLARWIAGQGGQSA